MHLASRARHLLWRTVCSLAGGLTVTGRAPHTRPDGRGRVLVANHASHADTAALLAALPPRTRPVFVAAADYWFDVWWRRILITGLAGGLPISRTEEGAYAALRAAAEPALAAGRSVIIYPEGTRSQDGQIGRFRSGAVRLAQDCGVEIVPIGVLGTGATLAKHGRLQATPMEVRIGTMQAAHRVTADALRHEVVALRSAGPAAERTSRTWRVVTTLIEGPGGLALAFGWGFAEAVSWPVMAELALVFFGAAAPQRIPALAAAITAGSVCGVVTTAVLARAGVRLPAPLTTPRMHATAHRHLRRGPAGIKHQALNGVPVKVYARAAGELGLPVMRLASWAVLERGARMTVCAGAIRAAAGPARPWLRRLYGPYLGATGASFVVIIRRIVRAWG